MTNQFAAFAVTAPGFAALVKEELDELGFQGADATVGGVQFVTDSLGVFVANLKLRIASRILVRVATFEAAHFSDLVRGVRKVPWDRWLAPGTALSLRITSRKSRLFHTGAITERVVDALSSRVVVGSSRIDDLDEPEGGAMLAIRLDRDRCTISLDSSGDLLHKRGYRQAIAKAPLRETVAAALLRALRWKPNEPLVDPLCGSGTIPIEAALLSRNIAPGLGRNFACERWPDFDAAMAKRERQMARDAVQAPNAQIVGSDRDAGAIASAVSNADRAGVADSIRLLQQPLSDALPPHDVDGGLLLTNPPWGERVGDAGALRNLYATLGKLHSTSFRAFRLALLATDPALVRQASASLRPVLSTNLGGIEAALYA